MRDIEAAFTDNNGRCVLSRSAASRVAEQLWVDYQAFATRSLGDSLSATDRTPAGDANNY